MNIFWTNFLFCLGTIIVSYLIGSIPNGVVIGKVFFGKDPRDYFSKNSGGTNVGRVFGAKIGVLTIVLDMLKTALPLYMCFLVARFTPIGDRLIWSNGFNPAAVYYWGAALIAAIGHCFPVYIHFKGGKAVASFMGLNLFTVWLAIPIGVLSFFGIFKLKKIVSISSLISGFVIVLLAWVLAIVQITTKFNVNLFSWTFGIENGISLGFEYAISMSLIYLILIVRHRENIKRLAKGNENKLNWH